MNATTTTTLLAMFAFAVPALRAQEPKDPPPWWGVNDEDTVSLHWDFNSAVTPLQPTQQILPSWYAPLPGPGNNWGFTNSGNITWLPALAGNTGVLGFTGTGTGTIANLIDNDFRPYWIKIFFVQFDSFAAGSSTVTASVLKDLAKYKRGIIEEKTEPLANGWTRTTLGMYLIPQPVNEEIDFTLTETALNSVAIDNLFVNSKCVKPPPDEKGAALGEVDTAMSFNLTTATGTACTAVVATEDNAQQLTFWVAGRTTGNSDQVQRLSPAGTAVGTPIAMPTPTQPLGGVADLAVVKVPQPGPVPSVRTFVYGVLDRRATGNVVDLVAIDADLPVPTVVPALQITLPAVAITGPGPLALTYSPHGDLGRGTFWIADQAGNVSEVTRLGGVVLRTLTNAQHGIPLGITGAAFDPMTAQFYWFVGLPQPTPQGPTQIALFEHDGYSLQPTGVQFLGDRSLANPGGFPGGIARGLEVLRRDNGDFRLLCVQQVGAQTFLRALKGPWRYGWSMLGRMAMRGGLPMQGNALWQVALRGVPRAVGAICFAGFDNQTFLGQPLPLPLLGLGMDESQLSLSLTGALDSGVVPVIGGNATWNVPMPPPGTIPSGTPVFFQWLVFDPTVTAGIAGSQAGETVIY